MKLVALALKHSNGVLHALSYFDLYLAHLYLYLRIYVFIYLRTTCIIGILIDLWLNVFIYSYRF